MPRPYSGRGSSLLAVEQVLINEGLPPLIGGEQVQRIVGAANTEILRALAGGAEGGDIETGVFVNYGDAVKGHEGVLNFILNILGQGGEGHCFGLESLGSSAQFIAEVAELLNVFAHGAVLGYAVNIGDLDNVVHFISPM